MAQNTTFMKFMGRSRKWNGMTSLQKDMQQQRLDQINLWISAVWSEPLLTSQRSFCLWLSMECQAKTQIRLLGWSESSLGTHISLLCQSLPYQSAKFGHWKNITEIILKFEQRGFTFNKSNTSERCRWNCKIRLLLQDVANLFSLLLQEEAGGNYGLCGHKLPSTLYSTGKYLTLHFM